MNSFLISGGVREKRHQRALEFIDSSISQFDVIDLQADTMGISDIRKLSHTITLKPVASAKKLVIINEAQTLTIEAQNALLKMLEEPPTNTLIVLTVPNSELLLPTIISRCQIIELPPTTYHLPPDEFSIFNFQFSILLDGGVGERLKLSQDVSKTREEATNWLEKMIVAIRQILISSLSKETSEMADLRTLLKGLQKAHMMLKTTNVNPRLTLENLFLNLPSTKTSSL